MKSKKWNRNPDIDPYWFIEATVHQEGENIFNLAYRLCGNRQEAEEIARAAFLKILGNYRRFEGRSQVYTYLYRAAFDIWKNSFKRRVYQPEPAPVVLEKGLAALSPDERFIVVLRDTENKSYLEIAYILKCRYDTVKSRLARARQKMRAAILPYLEKVR